MQLLPQCFSSQSPGKHATGTARTRTNLCMSREERGGSGASGGAAASRTREEEGAPGGSKGDVLVGVTQD